MSSKNDQFSSENQEFSLKITLKMDKFDSKLDKLTCFETIDNNKLDLLLKSSVLIVDDEWDEIESLSKYKYKLKHKKNQSSEIIYIKSKGTKYGRVYPKSNIGLTSTRREIRHTLSNNYYSDIDMGNCHPVILLYICETNGFNCKKLNKYVSERESIFELILKEWDLTRSEIKTLIISLINGGSINSKYKDKNKKCKTYKYLSELEDELSKITNTIFEVNKDLQREVSSLKIMKDDGNSDIKKSLISIYLQEYECRLLELVYLFCKKNGYIKNNDCVLVYDGLMIPKKNYKPELLLELENLIYGQTGIKMKFEEKQMNQDYKLQELLSSQLEEKIDPFEYKSVRPEFEKTHFKIMNPILYATETEEGVILRKKPDFINAYENVIMHKIIKGEVKEISFVRDWFIDPKIRTYAKLDFKPKQETPEDVYNTFTGFKVESLESNEDLSIQDSLMYKHLLKLCNNDDATFNYVLHFLSRKVKTPSKLTGTALIFKSDQGVGKDTFFNWFGKSILGSKYYFNEQKTELIFGRFNSAIENKLLIIIAETSLKETKEITEAIKDMITREINSIEKKGFEKYDNQNNISYVMLTNNDNPIKIPQDDRRFLAIECDNSICNSENYFRELNEEIKSKKYDKCFYDYLLTLDSDNFNFIRERPTTKYYEDIKEINTNPIIKYFEHLIVKNYANKNIIMESDMETLIYNIYSFMNDNKYNYTANACRIGLDFKKYEPHITKKRNAKGFKYFINIKTLKDYLIEKKLIEKFDEE